MKIPQISYSIPQKPLKFSGQGKPLDHESEMEELLEARLTMNPELRDPNTLAALIHLNAPGRSSHHLHLSDLPYRKIFTEAERENVVQGLTHAAHMAKETPIATLSPPSLPPQQVEIEVRKVRMGEFVTDLAIYVNGRPFHYQPFANDQRDESRKNFLLAHDIMRHLLMHPGMSNYFTPSGEKGTGQVSGDYTYVPEDQIVYSGLICNAADELCTIQHGLSPFMCLRNIVKKLRSATYPVGTQFKMRFLVYPSDRRYELPKDPTLVPHVVSESEPMTPLNDAISLPLEGIDKMLEGYAKTGSYAGIETYEKALPHFKDLKATIRIKRDDAGQVVEASKSYFDTYDGNHSEFCREEASLLDRGFLPVILNLPNGYESLYLDYNEPQGGKIYCFNKERIPDTSWYITKQSVFYVTYTRIGAKAEYTGYPYRPNTILPGDEGLSLTIPDTSDMFRQELTRNIQADFDRLRKLYERYEAYRQDILESGTLPIEAYERLYQQLYGPQILSKAKKPLKLDTGCQDIRFDLFAHWKGHRSSLLPSRSSLTEIAEFPPPPFKESRDDTIAYYQKRLDQHLKQQH